MMQISTEICSIVPLVMKDVCLNLLKLLISNHTISIGNQQSLNASTFFHDHLPSEAQENL
jgi:hypothetical protein